MLISRKLASLQDFLRMRAGFVDGPADPLSPMEMMHLVDEIASLHPLVKAWMGGPSLAWATGSATPAPQQPRATLLLPNRERHAPPRLRECHPLPDREPSS